MYREVSIAERHPEVFALSALERPESSSNLPADGAGQREIDRRPLVTTIAEINAHAYIDPVGTIRPFAKVKERCWIHLGMSDTMLQRSSRACTNLSSESYICKLGNRLFAQAQSN